MAFRLSQGTMILVHGASEPPPAEWEQYIAAAKEAVERGRVARLLVYSAGGGPNAAQRKQVVDTYQPLVGRLKTGVCTPSVLARGITTALKWVSRAQMESFRPDQLEEALEYIQAPPASRPELRRLLSEMTQAVV